MSLRNKGMGPGEAYKKAWEMFSKISGVPEPSAVETIKSKLPSFMKKKKEKK